MILPGAIFWVLVAFEAGTVGPAAPAGAAEGDVIELDGEAWQVHGGHLVTLDDPSLDFGKGTITVTGSRAEAARKKKVVRTDVVTSADIAESGARTLADVLEHQAGIQVNSSLGLGQEVQLDGLDGRHVLVLIDGRPVTGRVNNRVDVGRLPVSAASIERIEIVRGPSSALYGSEALGGVVNIITKRPSTALGGEVEIAEKLLSDGTWWSQLGLHGRGGLGPVALRLDVTGSDLPRLDRASRDDATGAVTFGADGRNDLPDRRELGIHAEAAVPLFDSMSFRAQLDGSQSQSSARTGGATAPFADRARNDEWSVAALLGADVFDDGELSVDLRVARFRHLFDKLPRGDLSDPPRFCSDGGLPIDPPCPAPPDLRTDAAQNESRLEARLTDPLVEGLTTSFGTVLSRQTVSRTDGDGEDTLPGGSERNVLSLYGEALWEPLPWLSVIPGGRLDAYTPAQNIVDGALGPKLAVRADAPFGFAFRSSYGRGFRLPSFEERLLRFDHSELGYIVVGNPDLRPEQSHGVRGEILWDPIEEVSLGVESYLNIIENLISETATGDDVDGAAVFSYDNASRAYTSGIQARASVGPFAGFHVSVAYQYLLNAVDASGCPAENPYFCAAAEGARSLPLRPAHSFDGNVRYRIDVTNTVLFVRGNALSERPIDATTIAPAFVKLDAGVRQTVLDHVEIVVGVENMLDAYDPVFGPKPGRALSIGLRVYE